MAVNLQTFLQQTHPQNFHKDALPEAASLPANVQTQTLAMLQQHGVHAGGQGPSLVVNAADRALQELALHRIVDKAKGPTSEKVTSMVARANAGLTPAETQNLQQRLSGMSAADEATLRKQLHIPESSLTGPAVKDSAERVLIRAAILNALAKNASLEVTGELRTKLMAATWLARNEALEALARPGASVRGVIDRLASNDYPGKIKLAIGQAFDNPGNGANNNVLKRAEKKVDDYMQKNMAALGLTNASDREVEIAKQELVALSVYTDDTGFRKVNDLLRNPDTTNLSAADKEAVAVFAQALTNGLARLPEYGGLTFRNAFGFGATMGSQPAHAWAAARYAQGSTVTEASLTSSSPEKGFTGKEVRFAINSAHGKETGAISLTPKDGFEATFRPNTQFQVLASQQHPDPVNGRPVQFVVMKESANVPDPGRFL